MKQSAYGLVLFIFMALPPVARVMESIMIVHMHMQMPLLAISGFMMARYFQIRFPRFFEKWNGNGIPGMLLFAIIGIYWMLPRAMDDSLESFDVELFKFISLSLLAGVPLRDSWGKVSYAVKCALFAGFTLIFIGMGLLYTIAPVQLCNNYLLIEQITLGWGFLTTAICMVVYMIYHAVTRHSAYE
ncbi:hypothetical protein [Cohnella cholangitidis]|uniref:Uncharacterized protein n=1 Tax=Cohnella cholangitidis TaxID=2598458 RepID=A0A7G5BYW6_9BACL|nr:hypothetical protein [Cohnella cholangitidis]QMV42150.1 hypothetical protein FPL14_13805 [Cohnella cholangitidis]